MFFSLILSVATILAPHDPRLTQQAEPATREEADAIIAKLLAIAAEEQSKNGMIMVGLAAPQIGLNKRVIIVRQADDSFKAYVNPEIVAISEETELGREGCYSVDERMVGVVARARTIRIIALDSEEEEHTGLTARVLQHEIDHLNGIRFPDRTDILHWVEDYDHYRKEWQNWPHKCSSKLWAAMKEGRAYAYSAAKDP